MVPRRNSRHENDALPARHRRTLHPDRHFAPPLSQNDAPIIGASTDLSHLVVAGSGDSTNFGPGLYEFVGTGNGAPQRVDLDNSDQPISECPALAPFGDLTGALGEAVSKDGRTIFFLALGGCGAAGPPADEIWARVDGTTSYDASESQCTRVDCNAPAPATFVAAASDGSSVFFTTTQQLVNGDTDQTNDLYIIPPADLVLTGRRSPSPAMTEVSGRLRPRGQRRRSRDRLRRWVDRHVRLARRCSPATKTRWKKPPSRGTTTSTSGAVTRPIPKAGSRSSGD